MKLRAILLLLPALFLTPGLKARPKVDVVTMVNGDRFTCEIRKLEKGVLYANLDYVDGTVSLSWAKVARVESPQLFIVHVQDGSVYEGTIRTPETPEAQPVKIEVMEPAEVKPLERREVVELAQSSESFWRRFSGNIDLGLMYSRGNDTTQYNTSGQLKFRTEYWRVEANYASSLSKSTGVDASTRNQSNIWARRLVGGKRKWFYTGSAALLQSSQQGIDLQTTLGGGAGRFLKDTNFARIAVTAGLAVQRTNYTEHLGVQSPPNALASFVAGDVNLFKFKKTSFDASVNMLPVLSQAGRVQTNVNSAYSIQVISNFWLRLSFYGSWDNRPPAHFSGSDYGVSSSISYKFN